MKQYNGIVHHVRISHREANKSAEVGKRRLWQYAQSYRVLAQHGWGRGGAVQSVVAQCEHHRHTHICMQANSHLLPHTRLHIAVERAVSSK